MSPALMEAYLSASGKISRLAIGDVSAPTQAVFDVPADTAQNHHIEGLPFGTRGGMLIKHQFPADGLYSFNVKGVTGYFQAVLGQITGEQLEVTIDGERVKLFDWDKEIKSTTGNGKSTPRIPVHCGPAHRRRDLHRDQRPARHGVEPAVPADDEHAGRDSRLPVLSARRSGDDRRTVRREGRGRHGQPPQDLRLHAEDAARGSILFAHDRVDPRQARIPSSGECRRCEQSVRSSTRRVVRKAAASTTASSLRCSASLPIPSSSIAASRSRPISLPARAIGSATSRSRRVSRSSSGAASPTTS